MLEIDGWYHQHKTWEDKKSNKPNSVIKFALQQAINHRIKL